MHPDLWTVPGIGFTIRSYGFFVVIGALIALLISMYRAKRIHRDAGTVFTMTLVGLLFGIIGSKGMHQIHYFSEEWKGGAPSVRDVLAGGGEILGGIVLAVLSAVAYLAIRRKPIRVYLDIIFPPMVLAMGIGRIGCLMNGCCWGGACATQVGDKALPWAIRFPYGSPAYIRAVEEGREEVPRELTWKLPHAKEAQPIPRGILASYDLDADSKLLAWAQANAEHTRAVQRDPDGEEAARLKAEMSRLQAELKGRSRDELLYGLTAATRLEELMRDPESGIESWADVRQAAAAEHTAWLHPTQLYDAVALVLLYFVLSAIFYRRKTPGMVVAWGMILYPINRILQEMIRADNPQDTFGLTISQFISLAVLFAGIVMALVLVRTGSRSERFMRAEES